MFAAWFSDQAAKEIFGFGAISVGALHIWFFYIVIFRPVLATHAFPSSAQSMHLISVNFFLNQ
jgi:hypothetical protein